MMSETKEQTAIRVSINSLVCNIALSIFKLMAGIQAHSAAMVSDSLHSMSDIFSTLIVMVGVKLANKAPDKEHPYGHERFECVASILLAITLFATGAFIGFASLQKIRTVTVGTLGAPGILALVAAVISIIVKEALYWYTLAAARAINSGALKADAWHHRSDALSSIGSLAGIFGARIGFPVLDPIAGVVICLFIIKAAFDVFADSIGKMTDRSCDDQTINKICALVMEQKNVLRIDQIKTRLFGDKIYVDLEISADAQETFLEAHDTAERVHDAVEDEFPDVKHCMVHVNPADVERPI
jgi:cation diffusion facilitator family transporter